jgi:hypothetical protein
MISYYIFLRLTLLSKNLQTRLGLISTFTGGRALLIRITSNFIQQSFRVYFNLLYSDYESRSYIFWVLYFVFFINFLTVVKNNFRELIHLLNNNGLV